MNRNLYLPIPILTVGVLLYFQATAVRVAAEPKWTFTKGIEEVATDADTGKVYRIPRPENSDNGNLVLVFEIENPGVTANTFMITGEVKTSGFENDPNTFGFLEMWTHMPANPGGKEIAASFFSRTLGIAGGLKRLDAADSEWRKFVLPANLMEDERRPLKMTVNVSFPKQAAGSEIVEIRGLKLVDDASSFFGQANTENKSVLAANSSISWGLIIGLIVVGIILGVCVMLLINRLRKKQINSELDRIKAVDSVE